MLILSSKRVCKFAAISSLMMLSSITLGQSDLPSVFVVNNVSDEITSFTVNLDGSLAFVGIYFSSDGPQTIDLSPDGNYLVIGHGTANDEVEVVKIFQVNSDASLIEVVSILVPNSPLDVLWIDDNIVAITETGSPSFAHTYWFDPDKASLTPIDTQGTGSFNTHLIMLPDTRTFYSQDSSGFSLQWVDVAKNGMMNSLGTIGTSGVYPIDPVVSPNGLHLYAAGGISNGGHSIVGMTIGANGSLSPAPGSPYNSPGQSPAYLAVSEDSSILFVGHGTDATVRSFLIDPEDGSLTSTGFMFDVGLQGTIGDVVVLGDQLFIGDESTAIDGIAGIYSFDIHPNGAFTMVGLYESQGIRPEAMVAWGPGTVSVPGDLNGDGVVNTSDILILFANWGHCPNCNNCPADFDGNCVVNTNDLLFLFSHWG